MTYMHLDVFPAVQSTRDAGHDSLVKFPGFIYVEQSGFSMHVMLQHAPPTTEEWGWQEENEGAEKDEAEC
jgi:hypothetical protein